MKVLITGSAGFIGFHTVNKFIAEGYTVVGIDNINDYYSPSLKYARLAQTGINEEEIKWYQPCQSTIHQNYKFVRMNLEDKQQLFRLFHEEKFDYVVNLAAQAGVRYSLENPDVYVQSNVVGFHYILEACRNFPITHLVHASSSSVYGMNAKIPFTEDDKVDSPISLYAATKKSNELMAHTYSHLYGMSITCLRFFTVYGPWGRPDMAPMLFATAISKNQPIKVFNNGDLQRDFTYVVDIVTGIFNSTVRLPESNPKYRVLNIGNGSPVNLMDFISTLEHYLGKEAKKEYMEMQPGDVARTWADRSKLVALTGQMAETSMKTGVGHFVSWFRDYFKL